MKPNTFLIAKNKGMIKVRIECMEPFHKNWKCLEKLSTENICRAILSSQNDDLLINKQGPLSILS